MTVLRQHQYELSALDGSGAFLFGTEDTGYLTLDRPVHSGGEPREGDLERDADGINFGVDYRSPKQVSFAIGVLTDEASVDATNPHLANLDYLDRIESLWQSHDFRDAPGKMAMLRACEVTGRTMRAYGRPRRYEEAAGRFTIQGFTPIVCDFLQTDNAWYADVEDVVTVGLRPSVEGGFVAPIVAPITTTQEATSALRTANVLGNRPTWPTVEFHGPVSDPSVRVGPFSVGIRGSLAYDEIIRFDPAPWIRDVYRVSDDAPMGDRLSAATPVMERAFLRPGQHEVEYRGLDVTGTSYVSVRWRTARSRP